MNESLNRASGGGMRHIISGLAVTLALACTKSDVTIAPPRVNQGGRAIAIAVSQSDCKRRIVSHIRWRRELPAPRRIPELLAARRRDCVARSEHHDRDRPG